VGEFDKMTPALTIEQVKRIPPSSGALGNRYYRPELDVVRIIAFMLVFAHHALPSFVAVTASASGTVAVINAMKMACGFGLCLFFTLSAFLICELLLRERDATGTVLTKQFYMRRILRIWPLYYFGVCLGIAVGLLFGFKSGDVSSVGWYVVFAGAWFTVIHGWVMNPAGVLWSISVEEHFYLMVPWAIKYLDRMRLAWFCVVLIAGSNVWLYRLGMEGAQGFKAWTNPFVQFESFAGGLLLCLFLRGEVPKLTLWQRAGLLGLSGVSWFVACYGLHTPMGCSTNPGSWSLIGGYALGAIGSGLILLALLGVERRELPDWAINLGRISFGLYVFHDFALLIASRSMAVAESAWPGHVLWATTAPVQIPLGLVLTIVMAKISYRYLEKPFLRMKKLYATIDSQPIL
jgi:peptidoglycan/LPS O-acetylase OafA/YrhL